MDCLYRVYQNKISFILLLFKKNLDRVLIFLSRFLSIAIVYFNLQTILKKKFQWITAKKRKDEWTKKSAKEKTK